MANDIEHLLQEIAAANSADELAAVVARIEKTDFDEWPLERLTDALREARERLGDK